VLNDATVSELLRKNFVPVAVDHKSGGSGKRTAADLTLMKEWGITRQGPVDVFVLAPDGKILARGPGNPQSGMAKLLTDALAKFGDLPPPRDVKPPPTRPTAAPACVPTARPAWPSPSGP